MPCTSDVTYLECFQIPQIVYTHTYFIQALKSQATVKFNHTQLLQLNTLQNTFLTLQLPIL